jgi:hypothetical protein
MKDITMEQKLVEYYQRSFPNADNVQISNFQQLTDGWETEIYAFTLSKPIHATQDLILRIYPGREARTKANHEFSAMIGRILGDLSDLWVIDLFASLFVKLHELNWRKLIPYVKSYSPSGFLENTFERYRAAIKTSGLVGFLEPISWIQEEVASRDLKISLTITHNDFHPYNIILDANNKPYVIDWGGFAISDYRMDLAWALMLIEAYRTKERRELFIRKYAEISKKNLEHLDLFDVMACARRLFEVVVSIEKGPDTLGMRPEALTIIMGDLEKHKRVYRLFQERTSIEIPEVEALIAKLEKG